MLHRALSLEERLRADSALAQQACSKALALRDSLKQAAEVSIDEGGGLHSRRYVCVCVCVCGCVLVTEREKKGARRQEPTSVSWLAHSCPCPSLPHNPHRQLRKSFRKVTDAQARPPIEEVREPLRLGRRPRWLFFPGLNGHRPAVASCPWPPTSDTPACGGQGVQQRAVAAVAQRPL